MTGQSSPPVFNRDEPTQASGICPLCNSDNRCAIAKGEEPHSCWCQGAQLDPMALAAIPVSARNRRCICPACGLSAGGVVN